MTDSTDVSDMKMTRFGYRVDLIRERHVRVEDEAKIASRGTDLKTLVWRRTDGRFKIHVHHHMYDFCVVWKFEPCIQLL